MADQSKIKVFKLDDIEWWAGESLEACIAAAQDAAGSRDCYSDPSDYREVSDDAMQRLQFIDEDGESRSFAAELERLIASGTSFPCQFAAEDF